MKEDLINRILYLVLFIGLVIAIGKVRIDCKGYTDNTTIEISNTFNKIGKLEEQIDKLDSEINKLSFDLEMNKRDTYDLWWATLSEESFNKIKKWEKENHNFMTCNKDTISFNIRSSFFSKDTAHAKSFVWELETGTVVYDREGNVNCYNKTIMEEEPEPIDCIKLCKTTEIKEEDEIL